ncbi:hypothetical protein SAMN05660489_05697 [Pseudomonas sp. LAMO17WK12:I10]|nr:hypothetical protein H160_05691 [Pseudomonas sp. LAMO17WK12:I9]SNY51452.1 hypothetical protein SAMN05660489_05697 [Pseudomonas sp. LAMO17WK12:I10]
MVSQQLTYQHDALRALSDISRQLILVADKSELNDYFESEFGISIVAYCWIWMLLLTQHIEYTSDSFETNILNLLTGSQNCLTPSDIYNFFKHFSLSAVEMPRFFEGFTTYDADFSSHFYDSPLKQKPFLFTGNGLRTISTNLATSSASFLLPHIFKTANSRVIASKFKAVFTTAFEDHIGTILSTTHLTHLDEDQIKDLYRSFGTSGKRKNVVDHLLILEDSKKILLIESKGVEQTDFVKTILDEETLTKRLEGSHIKGVFQSQQCIKILSGSDKYSDFEFFSFIITNDDFGFNSAQQLLDMLGEKAFTSTEFPVDIDSPWTGFGS